MIITISIPRSQATPRRTAQRAIVPTTISSDRWIKFSEMQNFEELSSLLFGGLCGVECANK
jgi:hypothetical protein